MFFMELETFLILTETSVLLPLPTDQPFVYLPDHKTRIVIISDARSNLMNLFISSLREGIDLGIEEIGFLLNFI